MSAFDRAFRRGKVNGVKKAMKKQRRRQAKALQRQHYAELRNAANPWADHPDWIPPSKEETDEASPDETGE